MAQNIIDTGQAANDGTGEPLRQAFTAINDNFSNIWAQGPVDSQVVISNNTVTTNETNLDLVLSANGIGNVTVNSTVIPGVNSIYDLGAANAQFDTVWARYYQASSGSFSGDVTVDGNLIVAGNIIQVGNIVTDSLTIQLGNTVTNAAGANGAGITVGANDNIATILYNSTSNTWNTNIGLSSAGNIAGNYFIGNGALLTGLPAGYANSNAVAYANAGWAGNIIPATSNVYSLGNATNQWNDLYVSNTTIYMNNVPISLTAGNVLTVDGEPVLVNDSNTSITTTGNITADNFFGSGVTAAAANDVVALNAFDAGGNTVSIQAQGNTAAAVIETYFEGANNRWTWSFDNSGTLTFPRSQTSIFGGYDNDLTINTSNTGNAAYTFTFSQFGDLSVPVNLDVSGNVYTNDIVGPSAGNVAITANTQSWLFDNNGTLTLPGNSQILPAGNTGVRLSAGASDATGLFLNNTGDAEIYANSNVSVYTDAGNTGWTFDTTGKLTAPGEVYGQFYTIRGGNGPGTDIGSLGYAGNIVDVYGVEGVRISTIDESGPFWQFDTTGNLGIPGTIVSDSTVRIDNRESGITADIQLYSADDILLQARDRTLGDDAEGGDINIYAGDGAPDDNGSGNTGGGDIQIIGGVGGAAGNAVVGDNGGSVRLDAGGGGEGSANAAAGSGGTAYLSAGSGGGNFGGGGNSGGNVVITGGDTTDVAQDRGSVILNAGGGGDETSLGGYVQVHIPSVGTNPGGDWTFTGLGTVLEPPPNAEIFSPSVGNLTVGTVGNTIVRNIGGVTTYDWVFDPTGNLNLPNNGSINFNAGGITQATDEDFVITVNDADDDGFAIFNRITDTDGNVVGQTELRRDRLNINLDMLGSNYQWQFSDNQGIMYLPGNISGNYGSDTSFFVTDNGSGGTMEMKTISYIGDTLGSNVRVTQSNATISTSNAAYTWTFDNTGKLTVPGDGVIRSIDDIIQLQSYDTPNSIARGLRVGTNGGLFLEIGNNQPWLSFTVDSGDAEIGAAPGVAGTGNAGYSLTLFGGPADTSVYGTGAGGNINLQAGLGASNDGGGGGPGGSINITAGNSYDPAGVSGNVSISSGSSTWTFDNTGNLTIPGNIIGTVAQATLANTVAVSSVLLNQEYVPALLVANTGNLGIKAADGTANITYNPSLNRLTVENIVVGNAITVTGNVTADNFVGNISLVGNVTGTSSNVTLVAGSYSTVFDNTGTATFPGAMQLAVYANTTVRDSSITSPQPGMMIYVSGTGMQVRGATSWNTIAGSGT